MNIFKFISTFLKKPKILKQISNQLTLSFFGVTCGVPFGATFDGAASSELELLDLDELSELLEVLVVVVLSFLCLPTLPRPKTAGVPCFLPRPLEVCFIFTIVCKFQKWLNWLCTVQYSDLLKNIDSCMVYI